MYMYTLGLGHENVCTYMYLHVHDGCVAENLDCHTHCQCSSRTTSKNLASVVSCLRYFQTPLRNAYSSMIQYCYGLLIYLCPCINYVAISIEYLTCLLVAHATSMKEIRSWIPRTFVDLPLSSAQRAITTRSRER